MMEPPDGITPVFIASPTERSGTNLLAAALVESGHFEFPTEDRLLGEDFLLFRADLLVQYCDETVRNWTPWVPDEQELARRRTLLLHHIGDGLLRYSLSENTKRSIVFKTPRPDNLHLLPEIFPKAKLLVIIRDGRDVVDSQCKAWPEETRMEWARNWAQGARRVIEFLRSAPGSPFHSSYRLLRYEDLIRRESGCLPGVMKFLGFEDSLSWKQFDELPVYGSSYLSPSNEKSFQWVVVPKPAGFTTVGRWQLWDEERKREFKSIAGMELKELGYADDDSW